jgi:hypothetical protein
VQATLESAPDPGVKPAGIMSINNVYRGQIGEAFKVFVLVARGEFIC